MKIEKIHPFTGQINSLDLPITDLQYKLWKDGMLIQNAMPNLSPDEREFLISGLLPGDFDDIFPEEDIDESDKIFFNS